MKNTAFDFILTRAQKKGKECFSVPDQNIALADSKTFSGEDVQIIYLDFNGEETQYNNSELNLNFDVTVKDSGMTEEQKRTILAELSEKYKENNIIFTLERPEDKAIQYSTVYVGKSDDFNEYGNFAGLAENIDAGNRNKNDDAFVFADYRSNIDAVIVVINHEVAHLLGQAHMIREQNINDYAITFFSEEMRFDELYNDVKSGAANLGTHSSEFYYHGNTLGSSDLDWICFTAGVTGTLTVSLVEKTGLVSHTEIHYNSLSGADANAYYDLKISVTKGAKYYFVVKNYKLYQTAEDYTYCFSFSGGSTPPPTTEKPDLYVFLLDVTNATAGENAYYPIADGGTAKVSFTVKNVGNSATNAQTKAYVYFGSLRKEITLSKLASDEYQSCSCTFDNVSEGNYTVRVEIDPNNIIVESEETNNSQTTTVTIEPPRFKEKIDFAVSNLQIAEPVDAYDLSLYVSFTVTNNGNTTATVSYSFLVDGKKFYGKNISSSSLAVGETRTITEEIYVQTTTLSRGNHELTVTVGEYPSSSIKDENDSNNNQTIQFIVGDNTAPDLIITSIFLSNTSITTGESVELSYTIKNQGNAIAAASRIYIYVDGENTWYIETDALSAGGTKSYTVTLPSGSFTAGNHTIYVKVDGAGTVTESNENNNTSTTQKITVHEISNIIAETLVVDGNVIKVMTDGRILTNKSGSFTSIGSVDPYRWYLVGKGDFDGNNSDGLLWLELSTGNLYAQNNLFSLSEITERSHLMGTIQLGYYVADVGDFLGNGVDGALLLTPAYGDASISQNYGLAIWTYDKAGSMTPGWLGALVNTWWETGKTGTQLPKLKGNYSNLTGAERNQVINANNYQYEFIGTGDFNGDGKDDVMLRNCMPESVHGETITGSGDVFVFLTDSKENVISGNRPANGIVYSGCATDGWNIVDIGDFNGDGIDDVLLSDGTNLVGWQIANGQRRRDWQIGRLDSGWTVAGTGDLNGDGTDDILLCDASGNLSAWTIGNGVKTGTIAIM